MSPLLRGVSAMRSLQYIDLNKTLKTSFSDSLHASIILFSCKLVLALFAPNGLQQAP
jgi:hypothetical protein